MTATTATTFATHTDDTAPEAARAPLQQVTRAFGFTPVAVARMAGSPELLTAFLRANAAFEQCSLSALQREVVVMTVARANHCHLCLAMHTASLHRLGADDTLVAALRTGTRLPDAWLDALRTFVLAVMDSRGDATEDQLSAFLGAGFEHRQALDVVLGVGVYTLSTYANRMTKASVDARFQPFAVSE